MEERKGFGTNFGFLMASVGSAVGLGNIWGFPNKMGASGGFTFLVVYLVLAVLCGFIVMVGELALGRKTGKGVVSAYHVLSKRFKWLGWLGILSPFFILFFYCALGGYCIKYVILNVGDLLKAGFGANVFAEAAAANGTSVGAEAWSEEMRQDIQNKLGIQAYDIYGLTELSGPGVAYECSDQHGMHICEDHFIAEIIDPDTGEVLPDGSKGELVFTSITKEAFPLIRYRTRDICTLTREKCPCGRTHVRMSKPMGRSDDMMIIRGVNVFPSQIEEVLLKVSGENITPNYQIIVGRENNTDTLDINVEMSEKMFSDDIRSVEKLEKEIVSKLRSMLGIGAKVHLVNPKTIARSEGKAQRIIDNRKL